MKLFTLLACPLALLAQGPDMPEGNGREIIQKVCTKCHDAYHHATAYGPKIRTLAPFGKMQGLARVADRV